MGLKKAKNEIGPNIKLFEVTSVDDELKSFKNIGSNGKRNKWNLTYVNSQNGNPYYVTIENGEITELFNDTSGNINLDILIDPKDIKVDSSDLIKHAKDNFDLAPGNIAIGYHFVLTNKQKGEPILSVYGTNVDGYFTKIHYNAKSSNYIKSEHQLPVGGGYYKENASEVLLVTEKGSAVIGSDLSPNFKMDKTIAIWGYQKPGSTLSKTFLKISKDGGSNWELINVNEEHISKIWFSDKYMENNTIFIATNDSIKKFNILTEEIDVIFHGKQLIDINVLKDVVAVLSENKIYLSKDEGENWKEIENKRNVNQIKLDSLGSIYALAEGQVYKDKIEKSSKLDLPNGVDAILQIEIIRDQLFISTPSSYWIFNNKSQEWKKVNITEVDKSYQTLIIDKTRNMKPEELFVLNNNKLISYILNEGGDVSTQKKEIILPDDQLLTNVTVISGKLFLSTVPNFNWVEEEEENEE
ncbi:hypothetical protein KGR20_23825 [Cytobacillus oceanisediminis]|uniref:hypothetical protein n=1 Tax=Cytobacillus oceanisediminis TaxID=665099 RepID=UPI001CCE5789|nr:hypothetical protein [Cytobacillus oceanisediminis]MBZ9537180.1 hypothetical protein [Cytobacillus oceanisediminis]